MEKCSKLKEVYSNILNVYNHIRTNKRSLPIETDIEVVGKTVISIYEFMCGRSDLEREKWYVVNDKVFVLIVNTKLNNIKIIIKTAKSAPEQIICVFKQNSNGVHVEICNKDTMNKHKHAYMPKNHQLYYGVRDYVKKNLPDEVKCWLLLESKIKGIA